MPVKDLDRASLHLFLYSLMPDASGSDEGSNHNLRSHSPIAQIITLLTSQISPFAGAEDEDIEL